MKYHQHKLKEKWTAQRPIVPLETPTCRESLFPTIPPPFKRNHPAHLVPKRHEGIGFVGIDVRHIHIYIYI